MMNDNHDQISGDGTLEIYIAYDRLKAKDLARYLMNFSEIADKISEDYFARFDTYRDEQMPTLDIETMQTGNSIKFKLKEGWLPKFSNSAEADIVVEVPRLLGIPVIIAGMLVYGTNQYLDIKIKNLDIKQREMEIQIKQQELAKAMVDKDQPHQSASQSIIFYVDNRVPEIKPLLRDTIKNVLRNPDITQFKVNGIEMKNIGKE